MKFLRFFLLVFVLVAGTCCPWQRPLPQKGPSIRVALVAFDQNQKEKKILTCESPVSVCDLQGQVLGSLPGSRIQVSLQNQCIWLQGKKFEKGLLLRPQSPGSLWKIENRNYQGNVRLALDPDQETWLVLETSLEDYVASVVSSESGRFFHQEALKVQAICSRTFAWLRKIQERRRPGFYDVFASTRDQVFKGVTSIRWSHRRAAQETRGYVLLWEDKILPAFFHSTCGGQTQNSHELGLTHDSIPPLKGVACKHCRVSPLWRWSHLLSRNRLHDIAQISSQEKLTQVSLKTSPQGTVRSVLIEGTFGEKEIAAALIRQQEGSQKIRSLRFEIEEQNGDFLFLGHGWGHGVGLCQWGSHGLAQKGFRWQQILNYYYPGCVFSRIAHELYS